MIIGSYFEGDENTELASKQHDVYDNTIGIITSTCNRFARFSIAVLNDTGHRNWGQVETFDHRTLQGAHDLLAAAWRFVNDSRQESLAFPEALWLEWLRAETSAWIDHLQLVHSVQLILANQNKPAGYLAESHLALGIMDRFYLTARVAVCCSNSSGVK